MARVPTWRAGRRSARPLAVLGLLLAPLAAVVGGSRPGVGRRPTRPQLGGGLRFGRRRPGAGSVTALPGPTVGMAATPDGNGYWVVTAIGPGDRRG